MAIKRVALIFDNTVRPETTGVYCLRALRELVEAEHFLPTDASRIPRQGFDLYLNIDDGLDYRLSAELHPRAFWAIDTHLAFAACAEKAADFDWVFAAQRDGAEQLRLDRGIASAKWLPLGCDPSIHCRHETPKRFDLCFVGNLFPGPRQELLDLLKRRFADTFVGRCFFDEMARIYSASRLVYNRSLRNDVNMRVFEAAACGSMLLTNCLQDNGQEELFRDGIHLATYRDAAELLDKAEYYLRHEELRENIAAAGREHAVAEHTYRHRMEKLLSEVEAGQSRTTASVPELHLPPEHDGPMPLAAGSSASADSHEPYYYAFERPELRAIVPITARRVLEIGCAAGRMGAALKARQEVTVIGIEMEERAAQEARKRLDEVIVGDVEQLELPFEPGSFDAVICGDVLEHLRDPGRLLVRIRNWLHSDGQLVTSIPNVRHHSVIRGLLQGNWTYEPAGLLDRDHLRFFTRREIEKLLYRSGFAVQSLQIVWGPGDENQRANLLPGEVTVGRLHIAGLDPAEADEFYAYQYLVSAAPAPPREFGLTSIVILTHNQLPYTQACVDSIRERTGEPYELIFVDNASTDGTVDYLQSLPNVRVIRNTQNRGFPAASNQGIQAASGSQVLLLNNDTVVTTGWLGRLLGCLHSAQNIGLVGPCSNCVSGDQQVPVSYEGLDELDGFAWDWCKAHRGNGEDTSRLVGFCLLIRREVIERVGLLDERFGVGCFEDDDYCLRALRQGFRAVIARDAFIHHFGGQTFRASGIDFAGLMKENQERFAAKWEDKTENGSQTPSVSTEPSSRPSLYKLEVPPQGGLRLVRDSVRLSLCMIVRDNASTITAALESIRPYVDELVVVDTGSTDATPEIARNLGARVFYFKWCDDFSAARNESLRHARGRMIFWMDSDDTIDADCGRRLRELAYGPVSDQVLGHVIQVHCPGPGGENAGDVTVVDHIKLFRNLPELRFEGRIHEQILPAIRQLGGEVAWTELFVTHSGYDHSPEGQVRKRERDLRLLHLELQERGDHPFTLFNLGMTYADIHQPQEAADYLQRCLACSQPSESHLRKAYALLVYVQNQLGQQETAWLTCEAGLRLFPHDPELTFRRAMLLHERGRLVQSVQTYLELLRGSPERHFTSVDRGIRGFKARHNLALVYGDLEDLDRAEEQWRLVVAEEPGFRAGWRGLAGILLRQGRHDEALEVAAQLLGKTQLRCEAMLLRSQAAIARGDYEETRRWLHQAVSEFPDDSDAWQDWCRFLFEHGSADEAEAALKELIRLRPHDASAHHNLGTIYLRSGRAKQAVLAFQESLRLRPGAEGTQSQLEEALRSAAIGDGSEKREAGDNSGHAE